jgi:hypothetical protein
VNVGAEPCVVGEVPAVVIGIIEDGDLIGIPKPVVAVTEIVCGDAEVEATEPETRGAASHETKDMAATESAGEPTVLPGMVKVVMRVVTAGVVADPLAVAVDVRGIGVSGFVVEYGMFDDGMSITSGRRRTVGGNTAAAETVRRMLCCRGFGVGENRNEERERNSKKSRWDIHFRPPSEPYHPYFSGREGEKFPILF